MKPRLDSAVLTREDTKIWLNINLPLKRQAPNPFPSIAAFKADRRDADLMLDLSRRQAYERAIREEFGADMPGPAAVGLINLQQAVS